MNRTNPRFPSTWLLALLLTLVGVGAAHADAVPVARPLSVRFVYLVSCDRKVRTDFRDAIAAAAVDVQRFVAGQLGGATFQLNDPIVEVVRSDKPATWFYGNPTANHKDQWGFDNGLAEAARLVGAGHQQQHIWVIYSDGPGNGGRGGSGVAVMPEDDLLGLVGQHPTQKDPRRWVYGLAHELGHALGLGHPPDMDAVPNAVMGAGFYTCFPDRCELTPEDKAILQRSIFIGTDRGGPVLSYGSGHFQRREAGGQVRWFEVSGHGTRHFVFEERSSTDEFWHLADPSRGLLVRLPRAGGQSHISTDDGKTWRSLYDVTLLK